MPLKLDQEFLPTYCVDSPIPNRMIDLHNLESVAIAGSGIPTWLWGVVISAVATALTALGFVLQKYSHSKNSVTDEKEKVVYYKQPWWIFGFAVYMFAQIINLVSMSMAPQVMLSCLGATALVFNGFFASIILGEELDFWEVTVMLALLVAVCMVICTSPAGSSSAVVTAFSIVGPLATFQFMMTAAGIVFFLMICRVLTLVFPDFEAVYWALFSACASGYTVSLFKAVSEMVCNWSTVEPLQQWYFYVVLVVALIIAIFQIHTLNLALNMGRAMTIVPAYFCLSMLAQLGVSEVVDWDVPTGTVAIAVFLAGIVLILVFIFILSRLKIAHEEILVGDEELAFASDESLDMAPKVSTPLLKPRTQSASFRRLRCCSTLDAEAFPDSFVGKERTYTISLTGTLAVS